MYISSFLLHPTELHNTDASRKEGTTRDSVKKGSRAAKWRQKRTNRLLIYSHPRRMEQYKLFSPMVPSRHSWRCFVWLCPMFWDCSLC